MIVAAFLLALFCPSASAAPKPPFEAEVTASSGPVQLTFRVHHTKLRGGWSEDNPFAYDALYFQIELKNIGSEPFMVLDRIFKDGHELGVYERGIYLEVRDSSGNVVEPFVAWGESSCRIQGVHNWRIEDVDAETQRRINQWKKEGVSNAEIKARLNPKAHIEKTIGRELRRWRSQGLSEARIDKRHLQLRARLEEKYAPFMPSEYFAFKKIIKPGESVVTPSWSSLDDCEELVRDLIPPRPPLMEAYGYKFLTESDEPALGHYTIRAIYEKRRYFNPSVWREYGIEPPRQMPVAAHEVRVETSAIPFEVVRP